MTECQVCFDGKGGVICNYCQFDVCKDCVSQYLLGTPESAHCMQCKKGWTREFMMHSISSKFVLNDYKLHREEVLMDLEKAKLPAAQQEAELEKMRRDKMKEVDTIKARLAVDIQTYLDEHAEVAQLHEKLEKFIKKICIDRPFMDTLYMFQKNCNGWRCAYRCSTVLNDQLVCPTCKQEHCDKCTKAKFSERHNCLRSDLRRYEMLKSNMEEYKQIFVDAQIPYEVYSQFLLELEDMRSTHNSTLYRVRKRISREIAIEERRQRRESAQASSSSEEPSTKMAYVRPCPAVGCRGFLSTQWKCGMCGIHACAKCHEIKEKEHVCKPENVETAQLLAKEAKLCPSCAAPICKVSGCDQIWCTQCHTAFSWKTRKVVTNAVIHNPHYYEWLKQQGGGNVRREIGDIPCGGLPNAYDVLANLESLVGQTLPMDLEDQMNIMHRLAGEMMDLREWYRNRNLQDTLSIRVKYLIKEYDDTKFKRMLHMRAKAQEKIQNIDEILDMFIMVVTSIFQRLAAVNPPPVFTIEDTLRELLGLCDYFNESMQKISDVYQCKTPKIEGYVRLHRVGDRVGE